MLNKQPSNYYCFKSFNYTVWILPVGCHMCDCVPFSSLITQVCTQYLQKYFIFPSFSSATHLHLHTSTNCKVVVVIVVLIPDSKKQTRVQTMSCKVLPLTGIDLLLLFNPIFPWECPAEVSSICNWFFSYRQKWFDKRERDHIYMYNCD